MATTFPILPTCSLSEITSSTRFVDDSKVLARFDRSIRNAKKRRMLVAVVLVLGPGKFYTQDVLDGDLGRKNFRLNCDWKPSLGSTLEGFRWSGQQLPRCHLSYVTYKRFTSPPLLAELISFVIHLFWVPAHWKIRQTGTVPQVVLQISVRTSTIVYRHYVPFCTRIFVVHLICSNTCMIGYVASLQCLHVITLCDTQRKGSRKYISTIQNVPS